MSTTTLERLYAATSDGLDILCLYWPEARACADDKRKKFRVRPDERTPSASVYLDTKSNPRCWRVTDFGGEGKALRPIDAAMQEERCDFKTAVATLCRRFGVADGSTARAGRAEAEWRPAREGESEGYRELRFMKSIPQEHLALLGPLVKQEHCDQLGWQEVETLMQVVKGGKVKTERSTADFPILARRCRVEDTPDGKPQEFFKIYQPLAADKAFRFFYHPQGVKPPRYINGLAELRAEWRRWNSAEEAEWRKDPLHENIPYREKRLECAVFCSGERDALCVKSCGYWPLWLNSETADVSRSEMKEVLKYVETVFNIPDIDATGVRRGRAFALKHMDAGTVWLPQSLREHTDRRGGRMKDLRDWMGLHPRVADFKKELSVAMPARFWYKTRDAKGEGRERYELDASCVNYFLGLHGFAILYDKEADTSQFVRDTDGVIERVRAKDARKFMLAWAEKNYMPREVVNLMLGSRKLTDAALENLREVQPDFTSFDERTQWFFFGNGSARVTAEGVEFFRRGAGGSDKVCAVWQDNVVQHDFRPLPDMFRWQRAASLDGGDTWDVEVLDTQSPFFGYLINTSRTYWREETELRFGTDTDAAAAYLAANRFRIDGDGLTAGQVAEHKRNLLNKMFCIGYMLHRFKSPSRAWAPYAMDGKLGEDGECNGRSGKSFFFKALSVFLRTVTLSGRNPRLMDNPHVFDQVTRHTDMLQVDDCNRYLRPSLFFDNITSDMNVNPKNQQSYTIPFEESPKLAFSTNYVPSEFDPSTDARLLYMVFSDWYHQRTADNDYRENRSIRDDFGRDLYAQTYPEELWNADLNFFLQCTRFYLDVSRTGEKLLPPMEGILLRKYKADMGKHFEDWAEVYFSPESGRLDTLVVRQEAYMDFKTQAGLKDLTTNGFSKMISAYAALSPHIHALNPPYLLNSNGRLIRKDAMGKTAEMIYLETEEEWRKRNAQDEPAPQPAAHPEPDIFTPEPNELPPL